MVQIPHSCKMKDFEVNSKLAPSPNNYFKVFLKILLIKLGVCSWEKDLVVQKTLAIKFGVCLCEKDLMVIRQQWKVKVTFKGKILILNVFN